LSCLRHPTSSLFPYTTLFRSLLVFGLQWLRKAILRASGWRAVRDEDAVFARERAEAANAPHVERAGLDWYAKTASSSRTARQPRSEEHTSELQSRGHLVCRLL